ncbi:hypothetical protein OF83DRAFT_1177291 [Amylostereum chailletii]|nr:hypothetical protein OF83DRAFT_1177291 [Amylostereum chailletii]
MLSFMKLATLAMVAFGTFAAAAPSMIEDRSVAVQVDARAVQPRHIDGSDMTTILNNLQAELVPQVALLNAMTAETATADAVNPIVQSIQSSIQAAVDAGNCLPPGAIGSGNIIVIISIIINIVLIPCGKIIAFPCIDQEALLAIFFVLGEVLAALLGVVIGLVGGVLSIIIGILVGLLGGVIPVILALGLTPLLDILSLL